MPNNESLTSMILNLNIIDACDAHCCFIFVIIHNNIG